MVDRIIKTVKKNVARPFTLMIVYENYALSLSLLYVLYLTIKDEYWIHSVSVGEEKVPWYGLTASGQADPTTWGRETSQGN